MRVLRCIFASALAIYLAVLCTAFADDSETVVVFRGGRTVVPYTENDNTVTSRKPLAFRVPALVGGVFSEKEFLLALSDARYDGWSDWVFIEMAARSSYGDYTNWGDAKIIGRNTRKSAKSVIGDPTAVMKGDKVYVLAVSWDLTTESWVLHKGDTGWNPLMYVGTVTKSTDGTDFSVEWAAPVSLKHLLPVNVNGAAGKQFVGGVGNGVVMTDGTIVLPIQIANVKKQVMASIIYSQDDGKTWEMGGFTSPGPSEASVVEWGEGTLLLTTRVDNGPRAMFQSKDKGKTWTEFTSLSGVWGNQPDRKGPGCQASLIKVRVEGTDVMLFSHPLNTKLRYLRDRLQLWMTNGHRVFHVGEISKKDEGERSGYAILAHVGENLYCMHEVNPYDPDYKHPPPAGWDRTIALNRLSSMMDMVKATVRNWNALDKKLESAGVPTNGLIGFLSSSARSTAWTDAYGCVDAVVHGAKRTDGGFQFFGTPHGKSQARWPVRTQGQNQRYYSTRWAFTLVATVSVNHVTKQGDNSVLGASLDEKEENVLLGLGYTGNKKWTVLYGGSKKVETAQLFELDKEYHVALTFLEGIAFIFVDGALLHEVRLTTSRAEIAHFFMGEYGQASWSGESQCTVQNVMLYNRVLSRSKISTIFRHSKIKTATLKPTKSITGTKATSISNSITSSQTDSKSTTDSATKPTPDS